MFHIISLPGKKAVVLFELLEGFKYETSAVEEEVLSFIDSCLKQNSKVEAVAANN